MLGVQADLEHIFEVSMDQHDVNCCGKNREKHVRSVIWKFCFETHCA